MEKALFIIIGVFLFAGSFAFAAGSNSVSTKKVNPPNLGDPVERAQFIKDFRKLYIQEFDSLTENDISAMQMKAAEWDLTPVLNDHGVLVFPHVHVRDCGYMLVAVVNAVLESKKEKVLALSVAHPLTVEMGAAKGRVGSAPDDVDEPMRGIYGENSHWKGDHSLYGFKRMLKLIAKKKGVSAPTVIEKYIFLTGTSPQTLPGIEELAELYNDYSKEYAVVSTGDLCHHGIGYGDPANEALEPNKNGVEVITQRVEKALSLLDNKKYKEFIEYSNKVTHSDWFSVGVVIRYLLGPMKSTVVSVVPSDFSGRPYYAPKPTWVLGSLIKIEQDKH